MKMQVILNVDDYCLTKSQIDGTIYAYQNGVVSSTTCLANMRDELLEYGVQKSKENPGLAIGCHMTLTVGRPLTEAKGMTRPDGSFKGQNEQDWENLDQEAIYQEFKAQIERFIKFFGRKPDHIDSHHQTFGICDASNIRHIMERIRDEYGLKGIRANSREVYYCGSPYGHFDYESFTGIIAGAYGNGVEKIEIGCHAAFVDEELLRISSYNWQRAYELKTICSKEVKEFYEKYNIERATY